MKSKHSFQLVLLAFSLILSSCSDHDAYQDIDKHQFNGAYTGKELDRIAFPIGGIGAGMVCLEGTGGISHVSVYNEPDLSNEPLMFGAISIKGVTNGAKILEGPVPDWKIFGLPRKSTGASRTGYGLPAFQHARFTGRFPFGSVTLQDDDIPLDITITGWSPFIPSDEDNSSLPCGALEYKMVNNGASSVEGIFSFNSQNFMRKPGCKNAIRPMEDGFILTNNGGEAYPHLTGAFAIFTDDTTSKVDHCWYRGGHFDTETMIWNNVVKGELREIAPVDEGAPGASIFIPLKLAPGEEKIFRVMFSWFVPGSDVRSGKDFVEPENEFGIDMLPPGGMYYRPWYSAKFKDIHEIAVYWRSQYEQLKEQSHLFTETFFNTTLPDEVKEAVAANLSILKSPTLLRQQDGRLWAWEGCQDAAGCCAGSSTHVWNYAQAIPHLFPALERSLRETEFNENQNDDGHQIFRAGLPIRTVVHDYYAAADGQLGGIMKFYRDWRISGDNEWMKKMYPRVKKSMDFCIDHWDPRRTGTLEEPQHNTYDINFWGPNGMCTSFYLGALKAMTLLGDFVGDNTDEYKDLMRKGVQAIEGELYNGEYFIQKVRVDGLNEPSPIQVVGKGAPPELLELLQKEGPKYQYGDGCLADGILGMWLAKVCGIDDGIVDDNKIKSHLNSVYRYNFFTDLSDHANPQRPGFATKKEGGVVLCTWPKGNRPSLPFSYSDESWTGVEYQLASHLMFFGQIKEGLDIVRATRGRYTGTVRNPFNEYECGQWYARALASYGLIQGLTGIRYDAVDKTLRMDSRIGDDFVSFLATDGGWGHAGMKRGKPFIDVKYGAIDVERVLVSGKEISVLE